LSRGTCCVGSFFDPFVCTTCTLAKYHERGRLEKVQFTSRTVVHISTGGIANEAGEEEPHDAPNRAGRLTRPSDQHTLSTGRRWRAHAEARLKRGIACSLVSPCMISFERDPMMMFISLVYTAGPLGSATWVYRSVGWFYYSPLIYFRPSANCP
jgi:hypothetical protein